MKYFVGFGVYGLGFPEGKSQHEFDIKFRVVVKHLRV